MFVAWLAVCDIVSKQIGHSAYDIVLASVFFLFDILWSISKCIKTEVGAMRGVYVPETIACAF